MQCQRPRTIVREIWQEELRRNLVQPIVIGSGTKIKKVQRQRGTNLDANEQILLLSDKVEEDAGFMVGLRRMLALAKMAGYRS